MEAQAKHRLATRRGNDAFSRSVARATDVIHQSIFTKRAFKRHKENKSPPWQTIHAIPVAMKRRPAAVSGGRNEPDLFSNSQIPPKLVTHGKANKNVRFLNDFIGVGMRIPGAALLILGLFLCFAIDDWEFVGLIPMGIGLILLTIAEKKASALALAQVGSFERIDKRIPPTSQNHLPTADTVQLSSEVLQLLERLNRSSRPR